MIKKIKWLVATLFVVCLFLPLSSCQYQVMDPATKTMQDKTELYYAVPDKTTELGFWRVAIIALFILPLLIAVAQLVGKQEHLVWDIADVGLATALLLYVNFYAYLTKLLLGGYLLYGAAIAYLVLSLALIIQRIMVWRKTRANYSA